ncbi:putative signal recognition particle, SRP9/SRP14 subunit, signal recognition particle SRP9 [Helianthus annuus]|nr:putative signal recognition particle, SRP9/SRP14 subunit, signal recognition particle SRP9 [Helianthus annuus]
MVYIVSWDDFVERSVQLFRNSPQNVHSSTSIFFYFIIIIICISDLIKIHRNFESQTRYVMKYRHSDGKLVLKVTDDKEGLFLLDFVVDEFSNYYYDVCIVV